MSKLPSLTTRLAIANRQLAAGAIELENTKAELNTANALGEAMGVVLKKAFGGNEAAAEAALREELTRDITESYGSVEHEQRLIETERHEDQNAPFATPRVGDRICPKRENEGEEAARNEQHQSDYARERREATKEQPKLRLLSDNPEWRHFSFHYCRKHNCRSIPNHVVADWKKAHGYA